MAHTVENVVDGAFFNSGQSCCGIERVYVHRSVFDEFVDAAVALTDTYVLGSPLEEATTIGPMVRGAAADAVRAQIAAAVAAGPASWWTGHGSQPTAGRVRRTSRRSCSSTWTIRWR